MRDMTVIYYTANYAPANFLKRNQEQLLKAIGPCPLISVSQKPIDFGQNICVGDIGRSHLNIYRQALIGAKGATTRYVAFAEDDVLYHSDHFDHIPKDGFFSYDKNIWAFYIYTKSFTYKNRINFNGLVCERDLFIAAMEERFLKWPDDSKVSIDNWAEPGKYEKNLGVTIRQKDTYMSNTPSVAFYHPTALSYEHLGRRKALGECVKMELSPWGTAEDLLKHYEQ